MIGLQLTSRSSLLNKSLFGNRYRHRHLIPLSRMCHKSQCVIGTGFPAIFFRDFDGLKNRNVFHRMFSSLAAKWLSDSCEITGR